MNFEQLLTSLFVEFEQLNPDWVTLNIELHKRHFLQA